MNLELANARYMTMMWSSLMSDNEVLIQNFLLKHEWTYACFAEILRTRHATAVFHTAVGKGKRKMEYYDAVVRLILGTAKELWLYPNAAIGDGFQDDPSQSGRLISLKKQLGGFFLLHTLFWKQPYQGRNLIILDGKDLETIKKFEADAFEALPETVTDQYKFILIWLQLHRAFDFQVFASDFGIGFSNRCLLNAKNDEHVEIIKLCKELQDELAHNALIKTAMKKVIEYVQQKSELLKVAKDAGVDIDAKADDQNGESKMDFEPVPTLTLVAHSDGPSTSAAAAPPMANPVPPQPKATLLEVLKSSTVIDKIAQVAEELKDMGDVPLITRTALLGNECADRVLINEAQKRRTRLELKEQKGTTAQRYDRDIFGSRKLKQAEPSQKRGRSQTSMNLWAHYIPENFEFPNSASSAQTLAALAIKDKDGDGGQAGPSNSEALTLPRSRKRQQ